MHANFEVSVLLPQHKEAVLALGKEHLALQVSDFMERELQSWTASWREESLEHYLKMGWSFGLFSGATLKAFVLAQPLLFYRGLTQTLWVEQLLASNFDDGLKVLDAAYRWARDKHFQCVLVNGSDELFDEINRSQTWTSVRRADAFLIEIRSAKF